MKYIVIGMEHTNGMKIEIPIMFPEVLVHVEVAQAIKELLQNQFKSSKIAPISGGFINSADCTDIDCCRESTSLKLKSRGELDTVLIKMSDYGSCIV